MNGDGGAGLNNKPLIGKGITRRPAVDRGQANDKQYDKRTGEQLPRQHTGPGRNRLTIQDQISGPSGD